MPFESLNDPANEMQALRHFGGFGPVAPSIFPDPITGKVKDGRPPLVVEMVSRWAHTDRATFHASTIAVNPAGGSKSSVGAAADGNVLDGVRPRVYLGTIAMPTNGGRGIPRARPGDRTMAHAESSGTDRRGFLQATMGAAATLGVGTAAARSQEKAPPEKVETLPRRKLGKTGAEVTILNQGAVRSEAIDRIFRTAFSGGIRMFDAAKAYGNEPSFRRWFEQEPGVREQVFLVTKDEPKEPGQLVGMLDQRLQALGTNQVDLFFVHGLGDHHTTDEAIRFLKSPDFARAADAMRGSGKARFVGFSAHHKDRAEMIKVAAQTGVVDAIMLMYSPWLEKDSELNKALDLAYSKGIGLISMKQTAGKFLGDKPTTNILDDVKARVPALAERNLTPFQGLLHAIWTDERISSVCVSMRNTDQIRENVDAARRYEPLKAADIGALGDAVVAHRPTLCADCDGRCSAAGGTKAALGDLARFYTYHEHHGDRGEARRQYAALSAEARDWGGADLAAAREACHLKIDFAALLAEVDRLLG